MTAHPIFERAFPRRDLFRGPALRVWIWSAAGALLLVLLLFDLLLIGDVLENRGRVPAEGAAWLAELRGDGSPRPPQQGLGLGPAVWREREAPWGPLLERLYGRVPALQSNTQAFLALLGVGVVLGLARIVVVSRARSLSDGAGLDVATRLRRNLHRQTLRLGPSDLEDAQSEHAVRLFTEDADRVRDGVALWVYRLARHPLEILLLALLAAALHWRLALLTAVPLGVCWYVLQWQAQRTRSARVRAQAQADANLRVLAESLRKTRLVRGYAMENFEHEQFQKHLERFRANAMTVRRQDLMVRWAGRTLVLASGALVLFLMGMKVLEPGPGGLTLAGALVLATTFACMYRPLEWLWRLPKDRSEAAAAADRIYRYLDRIPEVGQAVGARFLQPLSKSLQFEAVSYQLPNRRKVLDRVDLKLPAGTKVSITSLDPLEPRALAYLLPRFIEPHSGRVLFDGEDIAWMTLESLRAETVYVGGTDPFVTGTVFQNLSGDRPEYTLQEVTEAAKLTHANKFILQLPQGYETMLGEHGERLDTGQGFRLGLARAVLRKPALMIIEEPSSEPLDEDTKSLLDDAYQRIARERTVVFLPARLSTVRRSDQIVFLHRGRVEALGTHAELVRTCPLYRHWEYTRFNEFRHEVERSDGRDVKPPTLTADV